MPRQSKYSFSKEELESVFNREGSFSKAAKAIGVSKVTFRQQYLKLRNECIVCANPNDNLSAATCLSCYKLAEYDPDVKPCSKCGTKIYRPKSKSKIAWNKTHVCTGCKVNSQKELSRKSYLRKRPKALALQKESTKYKKYQKEYRQSERGKLRRKISNLRRKCAKLTTCSPNINSHIEELYTNPDKKCRYCNNTESLSVEHILPLSKGGTHTEDNVDLACLSCNIRKGNKTEEEYKQYLIDLSNI
jgi:5-methylcytosine-specific restriction endonuclease McrA